MVGPQKMRGGVSEETEPVGPSGLRGWEWRGVPRCNRNLVEDAEHGSTALVAAFHSSAV